MPAREQHVTDALPNALCPSEGGAATAPTAATQATSVALLASHLLRDGELVLLILRPSRWFILLSSIRFLGAVAVLTSLAAVLDSGALSRSVRYVEVAIFIAAGRLMWAVIQWMSRLYILTDMRILRLSGVFNIEIFDCALRKVARTMQETSVKERLCRVGSIIIIPQDEEKPIGVWQMVAHPKRVHQTILSTIARAKQGQG